MFRFCFFRTFEPVFSLQSCSFVDVFAVLLFFASGRRVPYLRHCVQQYFNSSIFNQTVYGLSLLAVINRCN